MDYKAMYHILVKACSDAIDALDMAAVPAALDILQKALFETEEMYIAGEDDVSDRN